MDGDPELLDDSEFYQQLLREFFEAVDPASSGKLNNPLHPLQNNLVMFQRYRLPLSMVIYVIRETWLSSPLM